MTTVFFVGMWFFALLLANKLPKISPAKTLLGLVGFVILLVLLFPILERSYDANAQRFETASASEDVGGRVAGMFTGSDETWEQFSVLGYGIGAGANASRNFMPDTSNGFLLGENEIDRVLNEGGLVGLLLAAVKWLVIIVGLMSAWTIFRRNNEFLPLSIWLVLAIQLPTGSVTGQLSVHGFILLLLGLGFLSLSSWQNEKNRRLSI
jgi:CDP-diglyceride synthetase